MSTPLNIPLTDIESVTNKFSEANFIGEGILGKIYEGKLSVSGELIDVAVRRLDHSFWLQDIAFDKEISILSSLKHDNLVSNVGFCNEKDEMVIINKREARGSLIRHLNNSNLTWMKRLKISIGVASVLNYLHNDLKHKSVVHHNVNSTSILLDEKWEAKLSGFEYSMTIPAARDLDVAYEKLGIGTYKSDVFSFGIVLFEILCGEKAFAGNDDGSFQASTARFQYENGKLHEFVDPDLWKQMDQLSFKIFSETAYYCLKDPRSCPNISTVLKRLEKALEFQRNHENPEGSRIAVERIPSRLMSKEEPITRDKN
ncbi:receptor-like protein kinase FERONIA [Rutidosis leptorrhynchoides]|uniref:receptor-like protein kinase FERONIA n=1 Tax=Rutidosis leptorrhynchoides TaxID=125765 RepID=UPI003A9A0D8C